MRPRPPKPNPCLPVEVFVLLSRYFVDGHLNWSVDARLLPPGMNLKVLLALRRDDMQSLLQVAKERMAGRTVRASDVLLPPAEAEHEVWGSGVTYLRSREAREAESASADVYAAVYEAARPEIFFKAPGWRVRGDGQTVRIRPDSDWNVPEPELTLVINAHGEIVGYTVGNDMSSRQIEGENPLYLPQAKTYNGSCAVGPSIVLCAPDALTALNVSLRIERAGAVAFRGDIATSQMKRRFPDLAQYLYRELDFPYGALLMTGTGIVPPDDFTLTRGDVITIGIGDLLLRNQVA